MSFNVGGKIPDFDRSYKGGDISYFDFIIQTAEPTAVEGRIVYADGTSWNPGSGKGMYYYSGSAWVFMG